MKRQLLAASVIAGAFVANGMPAFQTQAPPSLP
jgi:hypothetical protein